MEEDANGLTTILPPKLVGHKQFSNNQSFSPEAHHTAKDVCTMLGTLLTDSVTSNTNGLSNSSDSESEFDLSDPEAGLTTSA